MMALLHNVCRCHDDICPDKRDCQRWKERETGGPNTPHSWSLYPLPGPTWEPQMLLDRLADCPHRLEADAPDLMGGAAGVVA